MKGRTPLTVLALLAVGVPALAGCGGKSGASSTTSLVTPGTPAKQPLPSSEAVAYVSGTPIPKAAYSHWLGVETAMGGGANGGASASHRALGFLITSSWVLGEAAARHISVSEAEVKQRLATLERQSFPKKGQLQKYLKSSRQTGEDLLARVKVEMLESRIAAEVAPGKSRSAALAKFQHKFQSHWKGLTDCLPSYVMEDCKQYKGAPEPGLSAPASSASSGQRSSGKAAGGAAGGEVYSPPGSFSVISSAFERNGPIPAEYTCDGKGISPPLQWSNVPKGASELVLFVIDDTSSTKDGGIRWVVAGIDPSSTGVAAGKLPAGAIVGTNTAGKAAYSPICPAHGHTDTIEFVMYALRKPISLSAGFQPAIAEHEYGAGKDLLGQAAVNYAVYTRK